MNTLERLINNTSVDKEGNINVTEGKSRKVGRPLTEVRLESLYEDDTVLTRSKKDPTDDLVYIRTKVVESADNPNPLDIPDSGYVVYCVNTKEMWFAPTDECLNANFIYRSDLKIHKVSSVIEFYEKYHTYLDDVNLGIPPRKRCYLIDNPVNETYEVYYDSDYPTKKYGKSTPDGMFIHSYVDRFHRDMAILELDNLYSNQSSKKAGKLVAKGYKPDEAIIVSDGSFMKDTCCSSFYYMDDKTLSHTTEAHVPSTSSQGVLISEIYGAYLALKMCREKLKYNITYYYDNTSMLWVFKNNKLDSVKEISDYKHLCESMYREGYNVKFVELHPKTGENKDSENKALMFFHKTCDKDCRTMADIFKKDYKSFATNGNRNGSDFSQVRKQKNSYKNYQQRNNHKPKQSDDVFGNVVY